MLSIIAGVESWLNSPLETKKRQTQIGTIFFRIKEIYWISTDAFGLIFSFVGFLLYRFWWTAHTKD